MMPIGPGTAGAVEGSADRPRPQYVAQSIDLTEASAEQLRLVASSPEAMASARAHLMTRQIGPGADVAIDLHPGKDQLLLKTMSLSDLVELSRMPDGEKRLLTRKADFGLVSLQSADGKTKAAQLLSSDGYKLVYETVQPARSDAVRALDQKRALISTAEPNLDVPFMLQITSEQTPFLAVRNGERLRFVAVGRDPTFASPPDGSSWSLNALAARIVKVSQRPTEPGAASVATPAAAPGARIVEAHEPPAAAATAVQEGPR